MAPLAAKTRISLAHGDSPAERLKLGGIANAIAPMWAVAFLRLWRWKTRDVQAKILLGRSVSGS